MKSDHQRPEPHYAPAVLCLLLLAYIGPLSVRPASAQQNVHDPGAGHAPVIATGLGTQVIVFQYQPASRRFASIWESLPTGRLLYPNADTHWQPVFGDPDGDGKYEIVSVDQWMLNVWGDRGTGAVRAQISTEPFTQWAVGVADADGDGRQEILIGRRNQLMVWRYDGEVLTPLDDILVGAGTDELVWNINVADMDGDAVPEIVVGGTLMDGARQVIRILHFRHGHLSVDQQIQILASADVTRLCDWDGDGYPEIFVAGNGQRVQGLKLNRSDGTWSRFWMSDDLDGFIQGLAIGDLNGDGRSEIVAGTYTYEQRHKSPPGLYLFGHGSDGMPVLMSRSKTEQVGFPGLLISNLYGDSKNCLLVNGTWVYEAAESSPGQWELVRKNAIEDVAERPGEVQPNASVAPDFNPQGSRDRHPVILPQSLIPLNGTNDTLHAGRTEQLALRCQNVGWEAVNIVLRLSSADPRVQVTEPVVHLEFLNADSDFDTLPRPFLVTIDPDARPGPVVLSIDVVSEGGFHVTRTFRQFKIVK